MKLTTRLWKGVAAGGALLLAATACSGGGDGDPEGNEAGTSETSGEGSSGDTIKIGVLSTAEGNLAFGMGEAKAAIEVAMASRGGDVDGGTIGQAEVEFVYAGSDGTTSSAQTQIKRLVENEEVDIVLGPASGDEGETVVQYALTAPDVTFVNGAASPVGITLEGAENFFRFMGDSVMWMGGVGTYAYDELGYEKMYLLAEDYSFPYDNAGGFFSEFCAAGGDIVGSSWVPVGTTDYATIISQIPADADAIYVGLGGADAASFLSQAVAGGVEKPLVGGSITIDTTALSGDANIASAAVGMISGGPVPGEGYDNPKWEEFVADYGEASSAEFEAPSIFALLYYVAAESLFLAIEDSGGDLGDGHEALRASLAATDWESPTGNLTLDDNRQAVVDNFLTEVIETDSGLTTRTVNTSQGVEQGTVEYDRFDSCF